MQIIESKFVNMLEFVVVSIIISVAIVMCDVVNDTAVESGCTDREGRPVSNGARFAPDDDPCKSCYCADGISQLCTLVQCSPPVCANWKLVQNECCQYECPDGKRGVDYDRNSSIYRYGFNNIDNNIDVRLALSGTTTLLIIALLVFMVHRLRQRRLLIIMRRMTEDQHCIEHDDSVYGADDLGGFEFLAYKDPPPPYSSPPSTLNRHYDPPPYETATGLGESSTDTPHDPNRVYVAGVSSPQPTSIDSHIQGRELPCDVHISQTRL